MAKKHYLFGPLEYRGDALRAAVEICTRPHPKDARFYIIATHSSMLLCVLCPLLLSNEPT